MKEGDIVVLKSGGPAMTIVEITDGVIWCEWFNANNEIKSHTFSEYSLVLQNKQNSE